MTNVQMIILVAIPLVGILCNTALFVHVSGRVDRLAERMDSRFDRVDTRFDVLTGKVAEMDNRLSRVEGVLKSNGHL